MSVSFSNNHNPFIHVVNNNFSVSLVEGHKCDATLEYFDASIKSCVKRFKNDFYLNYGDQANVILIKFNDLNKQIISEIPNNLLVIAIDGFVHKEDYTYNFSNNSNTISLIFTYQKPVIGGIFLHLSLNKSIFQTLNYQNQTAYLINHDYALKLQNYYFLSEGEQKTINSTGKITNSGSKSSASAVYASMFLSPGSTFAIRDMLLMNIIQLLRYIDIAYPPNLVVVFRSEDSRVFLKDKIIDEQNEQIPGTFTLYEIYCSLLNNSFDEFIQLLLILVLCILVYLALTLLKFWKKNDTFKTIEENLKSTFVWNLILMTLISKYLKATVFVLLFLRYKNNVSEYLPEFLYLLVCLFFIVYFPFHLILIIRNIKKYNLDKNINKITPDFNGKGTFQQISALTSELSPNPEKYNLSDPSSQISSPQPEIFNKAQKSKNISLDPNLAISKNKTIIKQKSVEIYPHESDPITRKKTTILFNSKKNTNLFIDYIKDYTENDNDGSAKEYIEEPKTAITKKDNLINKNKEFIKNSSFADEIITPFEVKILNSKKNTTLTKFWFKIKYPFSSLIKCVYRLYNPIDRDAFCLRYEILIKGFNRTRIINNYYFIIELCRFFLFGLIVTLFFEYAVVQIFLIQMVCFIFYIYLIIYRPFQTKIEMVLCFFNEGLVNTAFLSAAILALMDKNGTLNSELRMKLGWSIVFSYLMLMYGLMINALFRILLLIYTVLKKMLEKIRGNKTNGKEI